MKKILLASAIIALSAGSAMAWTTNNHGGKGGQGGAGGAGGSATASASASSNVNNWNTNNQNQGQNQSQGQGQQQAINNNQTYQEAPAAPSVSTANNCAVGASLGVSGTNSGVYVPLSIGATWQSRNCAILREAEFLARHGGAQLGISHATHIRRVRKTVTSYYEVNGDGGAVVMGGDK